MSVSTPKNILVAHADARAVTDGVRAPLAVAVVRWRGNGDGLAVVARLALRFDPAAGDVGIVRPPPLQRVLPDESHPPERPVDFVFRKQQCDVLLVGHAHAEAPTESIAVRFRVGEMVRSFTAMAPAGEASIDVPLQTKWLRDSEQQPLTLGPLPPRREQAGDAQESYDARTGQCAPEHMQVTSLSAAAEVVLAGLSPRGRERRLQLTGLRPVVWVDARAGHYPLPLTLDTILIDTDFERIELSWRGQLHSDTRDRDISRLVVSLQPQAAPVDEKAALALLPRGTFFFAGEEDEALVGDPDKLEMARYEALEFAAAPELSVAQFAAVTAALAEGDRPRGEVLQDAGYDEFGWSIEERAHAERLGEAAMGGNSDPSVEMAHAFVQAQDALAKADEPRDMVDYARLKVALQRSDQPDQTLAAEGIGLGEWMRLERHYNDRAANDRQLANQLDAAIAEARAQAAQ